MTISFTDERKKKSSNDKCDKMKEKFRQAIFLYVFAINVSFLFVSED